MNPFPINAETAMTAETELGRLQHWMQAVITHGDGIDGGIGTESAQRWIKLDAGELESVITRSRAMSASERLAVYGNAYHARLLECLGEVFPVLRRTLGGDVFAGFAFDYLRDYPSRSYTLHDLARYFVSFLRETRPSETGGPDTGWVDFIIDLARLEWAIYEIFDGPGVESGPLADFRATATTGDWLGLKFHTAPCLRLLEFHYPVNDHYSTVRGTATDEAAWPLPARRRHYMALSRRDFIVRRYPLEEFPFRLLEALQRGEPLGTALQQSLDAVGESASDLPLQDLLSGWFHDWTAERCFFTGIA